ncbi:MAG TPA: response regulator transcription factor [Saprospiraceae bacterium]|nr:response regulator transcription factor [Saprospiraceae bacterium]
MKILIVEDDEVLGSLLQILLSEISQNILWLSNGWQAHDTILKEKFDLIVLDIMLPGLNGLEICKKARAQKIDTPILMLTSKSEEEDKVKGLENGADDYLTKPFGNKEFIARCRALTRRVGKINQDNSLQRGDITFGALTINERERTLIKNNLEIELTPKEFDLLHMFMSFPGRSFTRSEVLDRVWGENFEGLEHTVNSTINRLRMKIEDDINEPTYILTVWGVGYKFNKIK